MPTMGTRGIIQKTKEAQQVREKEQRCSFTSELYRSVRTIHGYPVLCFAPTHRLPVSDLRICVVNSLVELKERSYRADWLGLRGSCVWTLSSIFSPLSISRSRGWVSPRLVWWGALWTRKDKDRCRPLAAKCRPRPTATKSSSFVARERRREKG